MNYEGHGWLAASLFVFCVGGYTFFSDIAEKKGRKSRKAYPLLKEGVMSHSDAMNYDYFSRRVEAGDPNFTKFLEPKPRAPAHH